MKSTKPKTGKKGLQILAKEPGSFQLTERLIKGGWIATLRTMELKVLLVMCACANRQGIVSVGQKTISDLVGYNVNNVSKTAKSLAEKGYLELVKQGGGSGKANHYRIHIPENGIPHEMKTPSYQGGVSEQKTPSYSRGYPESETPSHRDTLSDENPLPPGGRSRSIKSGVEQRKAHSSHCADVSVSGDSSSSAEGSEGVGSRAPLGDLEFAGGRESVGGARRSDGHGDRGAPGDSVVVGRLDVESEGKGIGASLVGSESVGSSTGADSAGTVEAEPPFSLNHGGTRDSMDARITGDVQGANSLAQNIKYEVDVRVQDDAGAVVDANTGWVDGWDDRAAEIDALNAEYEEHLRRERESAFSRDSLAPSPERRQCPVVINAGAPDDGDELEEYDE